MGEGQWYLVLTRTGEERRVEAQLARHVNEVFLPLMKTRVRRWGRMVESVVPLFRCYLFTRVDLTCQWSTIRYLRGLREIVAFGGQPAAIPDWIIDQLKARCARGPVELAPRPLRAGQPVRISAGPLRDFAGIFERGSSNSERVRILLSAVGMQARVRLPAFMVAPML